MKEVSEPRHAEPHIGESSVIRDFVFGFGDGINTSLGIAAVLVVQMFPPIL